MATEKKVASEIAIDIEKELHAATLRVMEFESQIQSGEADEYDESAVARRRHLREQGRKLLKHRDDVAQVIKSPAGRRVMFRILEIAGPNRLSPNISDPYVTAESNGMRKVANELLAMLYDADPNAYPQMQREHLSDMKSELERKNKDLESDPQ